MTKNPTNKVLIITFAFPPNAGGGVQRTAKFVKYLPIFNWQSIVITTKKNASKSQDASLLSDIPQNTTVHRIPFFNIYSFPSKIINKYSNNKTANFLKLILNKIINGINIALLIPDYTILWLPLTYIRAKNIIGQEKPDLIYSSSPPPTCHIIAYLLKKKYNLPWLADYRDEWAENPFRKYFTPLHKKINLWLENKIVNQADTVINVSEVLSNQLAQRFKDNNKFHVLTNGYDPEDIPRNSPIDNHKFTITYCGSIYDDQSPNSFITALIELIEEEKISRSDIHINFVGAVANQYFHSLVEGIKELVTFRGYQPHRRAIEFIIKSDALLLYISQKRGPGCVTAKIFEYLATRKSILTLATKDNAAAKIIKQTQSGLIANPDDVETIKKHILSLFSAWQNNRLSDYCNTKSDISLYSRKVLTKKLSDYFNKLV